MDPINPASLAKPVGYSHGARAQGTFLAVAGQVGWDRDGKIVSADFVAQFARALENVLEVVRAAGGGAGHLVRLTIFVTDKKEYLASLRPLGAEYRRIMGRTYPAMTLVEVKGLYNDGALIEIDGVAAIE